MIAEHRYQGLDSLRGIAAMMVVFFHVNWDNHLTGFRLFRQSFLFVDLFFILSGFIIATVYGQNIRTSADVGKFMIRRFFRLYPLHMATLLFMVAMETSKYLAASQGLAPNSDLFAFQRTVPAIFINVAFLQGAGLLDTLSWNTPSWSISCEMIAYAAFAIMAAAGFIKRRLFWLMIGSIISGYAYLITARGTLDITFDLGVIRCLCGFFLGSLIARLPRTPIPNWLAIIAMVAATVIIGCFAGPPEILVVPAFAILVYAVRSDEGTFAKILLAKPLTFLGRISFSIYLTHYLVIGMIGTLIKVVLHAKPVIIEGWQTPTFDVNPFLGDGLVVTTLVFTLLVSRWTYKVIEEPGRELGYQLTSNEKSLSARPAPISHHGNETIASD